MKNNVTFADLVAIARRVGVEVMEAPSSHRGKLGSMGTVRGLTLHHTGTANSYKPTEDYPDFNVVKEGRAGLVNSLSAWGLGRHRYIYVFSEFLSWHAGVWSYKGITDGNGDFLGIEAAGVGDWTDWQRKVYPRLVASALLFLGEDSSGAPRHLDGAMPRGRKSDAANFGGSWHNGMDFYGSVNFFMANPAWINVNYKGDEDMPLNTADLENIRNYVWGGVHHPKGPIAIDMLDGIDWKTGAALQQITALQATVSTLATALAAQDNSLDEAKLKALLDESLKNAIVKVDVNVAGRDGAS